MTTAQIHWTMPSLYAKHVDTGDMLLTSSTGFSVISRTVYALLPHATANAPMSFSNALVNGDLHLWGTSRSPQVLYVLRIK